MSPWFSRRPWAPHPKVLKIAGLVAGVFVAALVLALVFMDWNSLRGPIARMLSARLDRPVRIEGNLDVRLFSLAPTISVDGLDIGNPSWAGSGSMAHAGRLVVQVELLPLFKGSVILPSVRVERPELHLLRTADGYVNWAARRGEPRFGSAPDLPVIQRFELQAGEVTFQDVKRELEFKGIVTANETDADRTRQPFRLIGTGTMNGQPFKFDVRGASLIGVRRDRGYPFDADITAGATRVLTHGTLPKPFDLGYMDANFSMAGADMADVYYLCGLVFPNTRPYRMAGRFSRKGTLVSFQNLAGTIGDSDMHGDVSVDLSHKRPLVMAAVTSKSLDLDDAATWFGGGPDRKRRLAEGQDAKTKTATAPGDDRIFPDAQLRVARVRSTDVRVNYQAAEVRARHLPIRALSLTLNMADGVMNFDPVAVSLPEGEITGRARIDATEDVAKTDLDARLFGVQLSQFKPKNSTDPPFEGVLRGRVQLTGPGNSVHEFVSASNGEVTFVVPRGEVRESLAELSSVNVARGLGLMLTKDQGKSRVRCGVANLKGMDGTLHVQNLVFDTENVVVTGKGAVSLKSERYDLVIHGEPKKLRLFRVRSPVAIRGPLLKPSVSVETGTRAIEQAGVAAALAAVAGPLGAVVAFVDPGLAKDADCASLLTEAKSAGAPVNTAEIENAEKH